MNQCFLGPMARGTRIGKHVASNGSAGRHQRFPSASERVVESSVDYDRDSAAMETHVRMRQFEFAVSGMAGPALTTEERAHAVVASGSDRQMHAALILVDLDSVHRH
jgi:hypothetical protein